MADVVYINVEDGVKRVMNNTQLYIKLLTKFKDGTNLDSLNEALNAGDMEKAQNAAHTIKGLSANLSLTELFKQSLELETQIKQKAVNPDQISTVNNVFAQTIAEVEKVITRND